MIDDWWIKSAHGAVEVLDDSLAVLERGHRDEGESSASPRRPVVEHLKLKMQASEIRSSNA